MSRLLLLLLVLVSACRDGAPSKADVIRRGDELLGREQYAEAITAYRTAVDRDGSDGDARLKLARAYLMSGDWLKAAPEAIRAADLLLDDGDAQVLAISMMLGLQRFDEARDRATTRLKIEPDSVALLVLFANATARFANPWSELEKIDEWLRLGKGYDEPWSHGRPSNASAADRAAEEALRRAVSLDPGSNEARLALANFCWAVGRIDEGEEALRWIADRNPSDVLSNRLLGLFYASRGQRDEAEKYLKAAAEVDPVSRFALADYFVQQDRAQEALSVLEKMIAGDDPGGGATLRAADIEFRMGKPELAMKRAEKILAREPNNTWASRIKAQALLVTGKVGDAAKLARAVAIADPTSREARLLLARSLAATGDLSGAFSEYSEVWRADARDAQVAKELAGIALELDRNDVAVEFAQQSVRLAPNDRDASIALVRALVRTGDFSAADRTLTPFLARDAESSGMLVLRAAIQAGRGSHDAARSLYLRALQTDKDSLEALSGVVGLDLADRQVAPARTLVNEAMSRRPKDPAYLLLASRVSLAENDAVGAEKTLRGILDIAPANVETALVLAGVLARRDRREDAQHVLEQALTRRQDSLQLQVSLANVLEDMGQIADARVRYERILATNPEAYAVSSRLAALHVNHGGNLDAALALAQTAKQHLPDDPVVSDTLGWVYVRKALPTLARRHLEDAVRADPTRAVFRYHLGIAYEHLGERLKARDELARALALAPDFAGASEARDVLKTLPK